MSGSKIKHFVTPINVFVFINLTATRESATGEWISRTRSRVTDNLSVQGKELTGRGSGFNVNYAVQVDRIEVCSVDWTEKAINSISPDFVTNARFKKYLAN